MNLKQYLILMSLGTAICFTAWILILLNVNPAEGSWPGFVLFYISLFLSLIGLLALIGFVARVWIIKSQDIVSREVIKAFRQAILFSTLFVGSLFLLRAGYLNWWTMLIYIALLAILEFFFISAKRPSN